MVKIDIFDSNGTLRRTFKRQMKASSMFFKGPDGGKSFAALKYGAFSYLCVAVYPPLRARSPFPAVTDCSASSAVGVSPASGAEEKDKPRAPKCVRPRAACARHGRYGWRRKWKRTFEWIGCGKNMHTESDVESPRAGLRCILIYPTNKTLMENYRMGKLGICLDILDDLSLQEVIP